MDRTFLLTAFGYAMLGILLGIYMAHGHDYIQHVTHAHIMLLGFVVSFIYAVCHRLWLPDPDTLARMQLWLHQLGTLVIIIGLFLLYGGFLGNEVIGPVLGLASLTVLVSVVMMKVMLIRATRRG